MPFLSNCLKFLFMNVCRFLFGRIWKTILVPGKQNRFKHTKPFHSISCDRTYRCGMPSNSVQLLLFKCRFILWVSMQNTFSWRINLVSICTCWNIQTAPFKWTKTVFYLIHYLGMFENNKGLLILFFCKFQWYWTWCTFLNNCCPSTILKFWWAR